MEVMFNAGGDGVVGTCDACESGLSDGTRLFLCARRDELQCDASFCLDCIRGQHGPAFSLVAPDEAIALAGVADLPAINFVAVRGDWDLCPSLGAFHPVPNIADIQAGSWSTDRLAGVIEATDNMYIANMVETKPDGGKLSNFYANAVGERPTRSVVEGPYDGEKLVTGHCVLFDGPPGVGKPIKGPDGLPITVMAPITSRQNKPGTSTDDPKFDFNGVASNTMKVMPGSKMVVAKPATTSLTTHGNLKTIENRERTGEPQEYVPFEKSVGARLGEAYDPYPAWAERHKVEAALGGEPEPYWEARNSWGEQAGFADGVGPPQPIAQMGLQIQMMTGIPVFFGGCPAPWGPGPW